MNLKQYLRPGRGASDITPLLRDSSAFNYLIDALCQPFLNEKIDVVASVEGRGFILGSAVAYKLKTSFVPIRIPGKLKNDVYKQTYIDYSGKEKTLEIHTDSVKHGEKVLLVDDWVETGSTLKASISLIEMCGGVVTGISSFMDDSSEELKKSLSKYNYQYIEKVEKEDRF